MPAGRGRAREGERERGGRTQSGLDVPKCIAYRTWSPWVESNLRLAAWRRCGSRRLQRELAGNPVASETLQQAASSRVVPPLHSCGAALLLSSPLLSSSADASCRRAALPTSRYALLNPVCVMSDFGSSGVVLLFLSFPTPLLRARTFADAVQQRHLGLHSSPPPPPPNDPSKPAND